MYVQAKGTYPCRFCSRTFSNPSAAANGHQNAHTKERDAEKLQAAQAHNNNLPNLTGNGLLVVYPFSSPETRVDSMANRPSFARPIVGSSSFRNSHYLDEFHPVMRGEEFLWHAPLSTPLAPRPPAPLAPPPPTSPKGTMFFGVPDFFKLSVPPTNPQSDGASITSSSGVVDNKKVEEEEEENDLDLDLKLF